MKAAPGVQDVHHIHVWQPEEGKVALEAHLAMDELSSGEVIDIKERLKAKLHDRFGIGHATLEVELAGRFHHGQQLLEKP